MSCYFKYSNETTISIPESIETNGIVFYNILIKVNNIHWQVKKRYKNFSELHEKLKNLVPKNILPPKKIIGNKNPDFIDQRRQQLVEYIQNLLVLFKVSMPRPFIEFLEFNKYDIIYLLQDLGHYLCEFGDSILLTSNEYTFSSLELHSISERLCLPCPETDFKDKYDFSHVLDFCTKLESVSIQPLHTHEAVEGCLYNAVDVPIGRSNLIPVNLKFNMNAFRNIKELKFYGLSTENISDAFFLKSSVIKFCVYNTTIKHINQVLLCDSLHRDIITSETIKWDKLQHLDLTGNLITDIDESIKLANNLKSLTLDKNRIKSIEYLRSLSSLESLNLSVNLISNCIDWHLQLGNLLILNLSQNRLISLNGLRKLYSLQSLDLSNNLIEDLEEIDNIANLPCLENLKLNGNPIAKSVDYRPRVLSRFSERSSEIILDNEKANEKEIDLALVLAALKKSSISTS